MMKITVTYSIEVKKDGCLFKGETCTDLDVTDAIAYGLIIHGENGTEIKTVEDTVLLLERLKGRKYLNGSITDIRYNRKDK